MNEPPAPVGSDTGGSEWDLVGGAAPPTLGRLALYFLRLGATGFGGPVALANSMRRDLVEERRWISEPEYEDGLAIAAACPGPLAYQLAVYCGYIRNGIVGGLAVAVAFAFVPFLLVVSAGWAYTRWSDSWQLRALFYGVGPVVVALIVKACWNLGKKTLRRDRLAWVFFLVAFGVTVVIQKELVALFVVAGILGALVFAKPAIGSPPDSAPPRTPPVSPSSLPGASLLALAPVSIPVAMVPMKLFLFFFKTGLLVFGSGLVIVPFLKTYLVDQYHWLDHRQFLDAVAIGMISPGPVVISATFVGYLLAGVSGAAAASVGIFAPSVIFTVALTPLFLRYRGARRLDGFVRGVTVAVVGVLAGTTGLVAESAIGDAMTIGIGIAALTTAFAWKKVPDPVLVFLGAAAGLLVYPILRPDWLLK